MNACAVLAVALRTLILVLATGLHGTAVAQSYPAKPVRIIVPFPPGDSTDIIGRLIAPKLTDRLGQPVIVENRPGAAGTIGVEFVARATPDGYTLGAGQGGTLTVLPNTNKNVSYNPLKDFEYIAAVAAGYMGIVSNPNAPFQTFSEMIAFARANPEKLTVASNGEGGFPHLNFEQLRLSANFAFTHVPYRGAGAIMADVLGGQVLVGIGATAGQAANVRTGKLRLLAVTSKVRLPNWPDVPAVAEALPGFEAGGWFGFMAPAGTPRPIVIKLNEEINRAVNLPDVSEKLTATGLVVASEKPEFFAEIIRTEHAKYARVVQAIGYQPR